MKNLITICMICFLSIASFGQAQETVILDPALVKYDSPKIFTASNIANAEFAIEEERFNEFFEDPIKFVQENFDISSFNLKDPAEVRFNCRKGFLKAIFNKNGELISTKQRYKDVLVPPNVRHTLLKDHKGWMMVSNKYTARGQGDKIDKEVFKIKLVALNGNGVKRIKIVPSEDFNNNIVYETNN